MPGEHFHVANAPVGTKGNEDHDDSSGCLARRLALQVSARTGWSGAHTLQLGSSSHCVCRSVSEIHFAYCQDVSYFTFTFVYRLYHLGRRGKKETFVCCTSECLGRRDVYRDSVSLTPLIQVFRGRPLALLSQNLVVYAR